MKKIILICLVSLACSACGEKKVTEKMLVGYWRCIGTEQKAKWENGLFQDYALPIDNGTSLIKFQKEDDNFFLKLSDKNEKIRLDFQKMEENYEKSMDDTKIVVINKLEYISNNEFKAISEFTVMPDKSEDNVKRKSVTHCTRIK